MAVAEGPAIELQEANGRHRQQEPATLLQRDDDDDLNDNPCAACCCRALGCLACIFTCPVAICCSCKQYEQGILFRLGRIVSSRLLAPGMTWINPYTERLIKVDTRALTTRLVRQEVLTRDGVTLFVDGVINYRIIEPLKSVKTIVNVEYAVQMLGRAALRTVISKHSLSEFQAQRKEVVSELIRELQTASLSWGIEMSMTLSDIQLPADLHKTMAIEANAVRNANANVISAEAELRSARSLKQAADIMNEAPITAKLRYLQTLGEISGPKTNVIAYALPIELLQYAASYPDFGADMSASMPMAMTMEPTFMPDRGFEALAALPTSSAAAQTPYEEAGVNQNTLL